MNDVVVDGYLPDSRATEEMEDLGTTNIFLPACQCWGSVTFFLRIRIPGSVPLTNGSGSDSFLH
jgi:hypothetical protein